MSTENVPTAKTPLPDLRKTFKVSQHKSALFRVVQADGVWCGVNAYNNFHLAFYSEDLFHYVILPVICARSSAG
jgi:hypothetical protein